MPSVHEVRKLWNFDAIKYYLNILNIDFDIFLVDNGMGYWLTEHIFNFLVKSALGILRVVNKESTFKLKNFIGRLDIYHTVFKENLEILKWLSKLFRHSKVLSVWRNKINKVNDVVEMVKVCHYI